MGVLSRQLAVGSWLMSCFVVKLRNEELKRRQLMTANFEL